jgi:hypothetical protein
MRTKGTSRPGKRALQEYAKEVEFVPTKSKRLGRKLQARPVNRSPTPAKQASTSRVLPRPTESVVEDIPSGFDASEDQPPKKKARKSKVRRNPDFDMT